MQRCDSSCTYCAREFFKFLKQRFRPRDDHSFEWAAATSVLPK